MRRQVPLTFLVLLILWTVSFGAKSGYQTLTIVRAEQKTRDRVLLYLVDTPIYRQDPYFEVAVQAASGRVWVGQRDPEHKGESLPGDWKPGTLVDGRIEKHFLYLKRPNGTDLRFLITSHPKTSAAPKN